MKKLFHLFFAVTALFLLTNSSQALPYRHGKQAKLQTTSIRKLSKAELVRLAERIRDQMDPAPPVLAKPVRLSPLGTILPTLSKRNIPLNAIVRPQSNEPPLHIWYRHQEPIPRFIAIPLNGKRLAKAQIFKDPLTFIQTNQSLFRLEDPLKELVLDEEILDRFGYRHMVYRQIYRGVPVWGGELTAHLNKDGILYAINTRHKPTPTEIDVTDFKLSGTDAKDFARMDLERTQPVEELSPGMKKLLEYSGPTAELVIWRKGESGTFHLAWKVEIRPNFRDHWRYFIDARTGEILEKYNTTAYDGPVTATATDLNGVSRTINVYLSSGVYYMIDATKPIWQANQPKPIEEAKGGLVTFDARNSDLNEKTTIYYVASQNNTWNDPVAVSAHYNMGKVFDYYYSTFGRKGIDDKGTTLISIIHVTRDGQPMDNAFWNGRVMAYGDGNTMFKPLAGALDVAAHEMTHGVVEHTVGLEYKFQSGALNESLADVFGVMVDDEDWLLGEDIIKNLNSFPTGAMRSMSDPHNGGSGPNDYSWQPSHMNEYVNLDISQDNGGVHINSGIPNHAAYRIAQAIGRPKTGQLFYRVMEARYLNSQANFVDMRLGAIQAAEDLKNQGKFTDADVNAVKAAYDAVGITGNQGTPPPQDLPPVSGEEWIAAINGTSYDNSLYMVRPVIQTQDDIVQLSTTQVYTRTGNPITVTENGSALFFIDQANYIRMITGQGEAVISNNGIWKSIAISPNGRYLATTTVYEDSLIYIFDLADPNQSFAVHIYTPTSEGTKSYTAVYADALDWNITGQFLIFDVFNRVNRATGNPLEFWTISVLDLQNGIIHSLFPPQPEGISVGNPSFSERNDNFIVFDYVDQNQGFVVILAYDIFNNQVGQIYNNGSSISYARYSVDDQYLIFEQKDALGIPNLYFMPLQANRIQASGDPIPYVAEAQRPYWFAIGSRTDVKETPQTLPEEFTLLQNYPNPFNPSTRIVYHLPESGRVILKIVDLRGRTVKILEQGIVAAGRHTVQWDGTTRDGKKATTGVYFYTLEFSGKTRSFSATRKLLLIK
jgi:Zn-dependent metalloprotease